MEAENPKRRAWWVGGTCYTYSLGVRPAESICVGVGEDVGVGQQAGEGGDTLMSVHREEVKR